MLIRLGWLREHIDAKNFKIYHVNTNNVVADCLTKPQTRERLECFVERLYNRVRGPQ